MKNTGNRYVPDSEYVLSKFRICLYIVFIIGIYPLSAGAQSQKDSIHFTLESCIAYALQNAPEINQAQIDEEIGEGRIRSSMSYWLPQIGAQFNYQHNILLPTTMFPNQTTGERVPVRIGVKNNSNLLLQADQTILNSEVLYAARAARYSRKELVQNIENTKINTVVDISKAFYDILLSQRQLSILEENIGRIERQYQDAYNRYEFGLSDKTDYQRASISLANTRSEYKRTQETLQVKYAYLKQRMGFQNDQPIGLSFDTGSMEENIPVDTTMSMEYDRRIEMQRLKTQQHLLHLNTAYNKYKFIPQIGIFGNYNFNYLHDELSQLYGKSYPASAVGLSMGVPIFQGSRRIQNIKIAQLQEERLQVDIDNTIRGMNTEYIAALAGYKSNYNEWLTLKTNVETAGEVYDIIKLQYDAGVKTYLELIVAESELKTSQLNYYNALYNLLASKLDFERALGIIDFN